MFLFGFKNKKNNKVQEPTPQSPDINPETQHDKNLCRHMQNKTEEEKAQIRERVLNRLEIMTNLACFQVSLLSSFLFYHPEQKYIDRLLIGLASEGQLFKQLKTTVKELHARVNTQYQGKTPLNEAIRTGRTRITRFLLENGANPNYTHHKVLPPVIQAVLYNQPATIPLLKEFNADMNQLLHKTLSPAYIAIYQQKPRMLKALLDNGATIDQPLKNNVSLRDLITAYPEKFSPTIRAIVQQTPRSAATHIRPIPDRNTGLTR